MKKQFTILLILIFVLGLVPINFSNAITQNQIDAEVQIVCTDGSDNWFSGSGTIIDPKGIILTNRHVVEGAYMNTCFIGFIESISQEPNFGTSGNYNLAEVKYQTASNNIDAAILYLDNPTNKTYPYINIWDSNSDALQFGDKIEVIGFPSIGGSTITYTSGDFSGFGSSADGTQNYIKSTAPLEHGNSGGASYNSSGQFIGIPTMVVAGTLNSMSYVLSVNSIKDWLSGILGSGYQEEVIEQEPIIEEPTVNIQEDITPLDVNEISLSYYAMDNGKNFKVLLNLPYAKADEAYTFASQIKFNWGQWKSDDLIGYYYYFGKNIFANPTEDGIFIPSVGKGEVYSPEIKLQEEDDYYFILKTKDTNQNISDKFIYKIHYSPYSKGQLNAITFFSDKSYSKVLKSYKIKFDKYFTDKGEAINWNPHPQQDAIVCQTKLDNLYFKWDYLDEINKEHVILSKNQIGDTSFYTEWWNGYLTDIKLELLEGEYINSNKSNIENMSNGEVIKQEYSKTLYPKNVYKQDESMINYEFYAKPYVDNLKIAADDRLFSVKYDPSSSENISCVFHYWEPTVRGGSGKYEIRELEEINQSTSQKQYDLNMVRKLLGKILLQVEQNGEAYYVYPDDSKRYYLGRPADAFNAMRKLGLGATHQFINNYTIYPDHVLGKILIDVEQNGEAYYIYPKDKKAYYLGRPADAFRIMRELGLGITNSDLSKIPEGSL